MFKPRFVQIIILIILLSPWLKVKADLIIGGDDANTSLIEIFAKHFEKNMNRGHVKLITTLGSKGGIAALNDRKIQIALVTRLLSPAEEAFNLTSVPYAKSCLAFVVNPKVPLADDSMTSEALEQIYDGQKTTWSDKKTIQVIFHPRGDSGSELLMIKFPNLKPLFEKAWTTSVWRTEIGDKKNLALIEKINYSFGWVNQTELAASKSPARVLKFNGIMPEAALAESGKYPLVEVSTLVYKEPATQEVKDFIALVKSEYGAQILRQNEAVPIR